MDSLSSFVTIIIIRSSFVSVCKLKDLLKLFKDLLKPLQDLQALKELLEALEDLL